MKTILWFGTKPAVKIKSLSSLFGEKTDDENHLIGGSGLDPTGKAKHELQHIPTCAFFE
jgi:hypothetical protein